MASTHGIKCLSCGEKDLGYPPLTKYTYGDDQWIYVFENNDVSVLTKLNDEKENRTRPTTANFRI